MQSLEFDTGIPSSGEWEGSCETLAKCDSLEDH